MFLAFSLLLFSLFQCQQQRHLEFLCCHYTLHSRLGKMEILTRLDGMVFALISAYWLDNSFGKYKKTKTFGLVLLFHLQDRVAHFVRNPALPTGQPLRGSW